MISPTNLRPSTVKALVLILVFMFGSILALGVNAASPHRTVYYRISGDLSQTGGVAEVIGNWRLHVKINASGGWDAREKEFRWYDRVWTFNAEFTMRIPKDVAHHFSLRNLKHCHYLGGWAYWYGKGHGKRYAGPYVFGVKGYIDVFMDGKLLAKNVYIEVVLTKEAGRQGTVIITLHHSYFTEVAGGTLKGRIHRFQVIDFMSQ